jgi:type I restriction enzyme S subunit
MSEWQSMRIGQHVTIIPGFPFDSNRFDDEDGVPLVRIRDLLAGTTETNFNGHYDPLYLIGPGDILVGMDGDFNIARWKGGTALLNQRMLKIADKKSGEIDCRFLFYVLGPLLKDINNKTSATTVKHLSTYDISDAFIPSPPLPQQRKIARILTTVDNLIEKTEALIAKYQAIKQGMMHDLFTRGVDEHGHLRPPYEQAPEFYKQSELGWIPKEWEVCLLDEVAIRGSGHTPNKLIGAYWNGGIKWVSLADSDKLDRLFITDTDKNISELGLANSSAVRHRPGTVILSRDAGIGKSAIISEVMAVSQHFMAWFCGPRLINFFLYYWLQHEKPSFEAIAMGSTIKTIGLSFFKKLRIAVPSIAEQRFGSDAVLAVERRLIGMAEELAKYREQKTGLMQDLLTGKVRVKVDATEEVAAHV